MRKQAGRYQHCAEGPSLIQPQLALPPPLTKLLPGSRFFARALDVLGRVAPALRRPGFGRRPDHSAGVDFLATLLALAAGLFPL